MEVIQNYLEDVIAAARAVDLKELDRAIRLFEQCYHEDHAVYVIGNGGSAANASHFAQDLSKGSMPDLEGRRLRVVSLTDNAAYLTATANDLGYDRVFDVQLRALARPGDVLVAISGSGNSPNIVKAAEYARSVKSTVVGVTGFDGGKLMQLSDIRLHVPVMDMCKSEAVHSILLHMVSDILRLRLRG